MTRWLMLFLWWVTLSAYCAEPDQVARWKAARFDARWQTTADKVIQRYQQNFATYSGLEKARANGVPAQFIAAFHERESSGSFAKHLHEGSSLRGRTQWVPKGRPLRPDPPYDFVISALDALYTYEGLEKRDWKKVQPALQAAESYNGLGYQRMGRVSPYLWSGTSLYVSGKYVRDGVYSATAKDGQIGVGGILKRMEQRGLEMPPAFRATAPVTQEPPPATPPLPTSPPTPSVPKPPATVRASIVAVQGELVRRGLLEKADGIAGPKTWEAIRKIIAP